MWPFRHVVGQSEELECYNLIILYSCELVDLWAAADVAKPCKISIPPAHPHRYSGSRGRHRRRARRRDSTPYPFTPPEPPTGVAASESPRSPGRRGCCGHRCCRCRPATVARSGPEPRRVAPRLIPGRVGRRLESQFHTLQLDGLLIKAHLNAHLRTLSLRDTAVHTCTRWHQVMAPAQLVPQSMPAWTNLNTPLTRRMTYRPSAANSATLPHTLHLAMYCTVTVLRSGHGDWTIGLRLGHWQES